GAGPGARRADQVVAAGVTDPRQGVVLGKERDAGSAAPEPLPCHERGREPRGTPPHPEPFPFEKPTDQPGRLEFFKTHLRATMKGAVPSIPGPGAKRPTRELAGGPPVSAPLFGLAPCGVCRAAPVTRDAGGLLPHRFTLTGKGGGASRPGGLFSVALSFPSPGLGVTQRNALWSSDFPLPGLPSGQRPSGSLRPRAILTKPRIATQQRMLRYGSPRLSETGCPETSLSRKIFRTASKPSARCSAPS